MKKNIHAIGDKLLKLEHLVVIICCIAIVLLVFVTVLMRYIFKTSFQGMEDLVMLFAFGIYFIGAALSSRDESQITADILSVCIHKPRTLTLIRAVRNLIDCGLIGACALFSGRQMLFVWDTGSRTSGLKMPMWIPYAVILAGLFLMACYALYHTINYFHQFIHFHSDAEEGQP